MQGCACAWACGGVGLWSRGQSAARAQPERGQSLRASPEGGTGALSAPRGMGRQREASGAVDWHREGGRYFGPARARRSFQMTPPCSGSYLHLPEAALTVATAVFLGRGILMTTW